jgi:hypothetical protein
VNRIERASYGSEAGLTRPGFALGTDQRHRANEKRRRLWDCHSMGA